MFNLFFVLVSGLSLDYVSDGDTVALKTEEGLVLKGRLIVIDCPEIPHKAGHGRRKQPGQPGGLEAKDRLADLLKSGFEVQTYGSDAYGRSLVELILKDKKPANLIMVEEGYCEVYQKAKANRGKSFELFPYRMAENKAQKAKKGIWGFKHYEPPGIFRRRLR